MAGRGPAPKPGDQRARRNRDPIPSTTVDFVKAKQPVLPRRMPSGEAWPARTRAWWRRWARDPRARRFDGAAWEYLLDTAVIHGQLWSGDHKAAGELRLRLERFGVTPGDRARLRVQLDDGLEGTASVAEPERPARRVRARERYSGLRVVGGSEPEE